jgi:hypothetical protein
VTHRSHVKLAYEEPEGSLVPIVALTRVSLWPPIGWSETGDGSLLRSGGETWGPVPPDNV